MIRLLLTKFKNILLLLLIGGMVLTSTHTAHADEYFKYTVNQDYINISVETMSQAPQRQCEVIIRAGEYQGKAGKRIYINNTTVKLPNDIPVRNDGDGKGFYVSEWDINVKEAKALVEKLQARGINAKLQVAYSKSEDLNAAGRIANKSNPKLYVSIHHNYYDSNSTGYFSMYNPNNTKSKEVADRLSNAINNNGRVPQRPSRENTGYIGELNVINSSTVPVLLELGFFSNIDELEKICSDSYVQYISTQLANEITNIIKE
jgi:N-acetylmuramoyl-L-alanine amidase